MKAHRRFIAVLTAVAVLVTPMASSAQEGPGPDPTEGATDPAAFEVGAYSDELGISLDEARRRLELSRSLNPIIDALHESYPDAYAGVVIDHGPEYHIDIRFVGAPPT